MKSSVDTFIHLQLPILSIIFNSIRCWDIECSQFLVALRAYDKAFANTYTNEINTIEVGLIPISAYAIHWIELSFIFFWIICSYLISDLILNCFIRRYYENIKCNIDWNVPCLLIMFVVFKFMKYSFLMTSSLHKPLSGISFTLSDYFSFSSQWVSEGESFVYCLIPIQSDDLSGLLLQIISHPIFIWSINLDKIVNTI